MAASQLSSLRRYEIARVYRRGVGRSAPRELLQGEAHRLSLDRKTWTFYKIDDPIDVSTLACRLWLYNVISPKAHQIWVRLRGFPLEENVVLYLDS